MNHLIVYAHPCDGSFNNAILKTVVSGIESNANNKVYVIDLNKENFNPVMTADDLRGFNRGKSLDPKVIEYQKRIEEANHIIFIFPIWFGCMPAILKGFCDKVFVKGWAHDDKGRIPKGLIKNKTATVISTMASPGFFYSMANNNAIKGTLINGVIKFSGMKLNKWFRIADVISAGNPKREQWLKDIENHVQKY